MRRSIVLALLVGLAASSIVRADDKNKTTLSSPDGAYQLVASDAWESANFPANNIQIGAQNKHDGEYVEVIVEDLRDYTDSIVRYTEAKRDTMALSLDNPKLTAPVETQINGYKAVRCEIHGTLPNSNTSVGYLLTVLKTKTHYVQIVAWTKESRFATCKADLTSLAEGFSETADNAR